MTTARRQHFISRFYLRNFAEPLHSDSLCYLDLAKGHWEKRTPRGVGWYPYLCSMLDAEGKRADGFDVFLKTNVEDPASGAFRRLATNGDPSEQEREALALFISLTFARAPGQMSEAVSEYLQDLDERERRELEGLLEAWCASIKRPVDAAMRVEFMKPSYFGGLWIWCRSLQRRLLNWNWHWLRAEREQPFVTSDKPTFACWDKNRDIRLVSFPISAERALIIASAGVFKGLSEGTEDIAVMNRQSVVGASEFVVSCRESFPGEDAIQRPP